MTHGDSQDVSLLLNGEPEDSPESLPVGQNGVATSREPPAGSEEEVVIPHNVWTIIASLWVGSFLSAADSTIVSTTASSIASSMNGSDQITYIAAAYLMTNSIFQPLVGKVSDIYGRRLTLISAQFWFALGCLLCALSQNVTQFTIARAVAGIGGGGMSALSSIIVTDVIPLRIRGMFQGYANVMYGTGQFIGPVVGSAFLTWNPKSGWRWMFGLQVPLVVIAGVLVNKNVHDYKFDSVERAANRWNLSNLKRIDLLGSFTGATFIISIVAMFSATTAAAIGLSALAALVSAVSFYLVEKYLVTDHIVPPSAFQGVLRIAALCSLFGTMSCYGINYIIPIYIQVIHDFSSFQIGLFNALGVFAIPMGSLTAGWFLKNDQKTTSAAVTNKAINVSIAACLVFFIGTFVIMGSVHGIEPSESRSGLMAAKILPIALGFFIATLGYGGLLVSILILIVGVVGIRHQASVTGMNYMFRSLGSVSGVGISLGIYNHVLRNELYEYFVIGGKPDGETILAKLLKNTLYLRSGMDRTYLGQTLLIFRAALADSSTMIFVLGLLTVALSLVFKIYKPDASISMV